MLWGKMPLNSTFERQPISNTFSSTFLKGTSTFEKLDRIQVFSVSGLRTMAVGSCKE